MKQNLGLLFLHYLRLLAKLQLTKIKLLNPRLKIIGITGSAGKSSAINACEAILTPDYRVKTTANANTESGIPLNILGLKATSFSFVDWIKYGCLSFFKLLTNWHIYDIYLVEMGIDSPKEPKNMDYLLKIVKPDIGIFLNVNSVHLESFDSIEQLAREKAKLVNTSTDAIINATDQLVKKYSTNPNTINIINHHIDIPSTALPKAFDITFGAAITMAQFFDISSTVAISRIKQNFHLPPGRSSLFKGIKQSQIIDSSYNSSPIATIEMLQLLHTYPSPRIAILGDMRELGKVSSSEHNKIYQYATKLADTVISIGPETKKYFGPKSTKFDYWWQASEYLRNHSPILRKASILVKGSQNTIFLEELVKDLLADPKDAKLLCRQSKYWKNLKNAFKIVHEKPHRL